MGNSEKTNLNIFDKDKILIIYNKLIDDQSGHDSYFINYVFNRHGHLEEKTLTAIFKEFYGDKKDDSALLGPFQTLSSLRSYCRKLIQYFQVKDGVLLTLEAYNESIESSPDLSSLKSGLLGKGEIVKIKNKNGAKKLFLSKFFN